MSAKPDIIPYSLRLKLDANKPEVVHFGFMQDGNSYKKQLVNSAGQNDEHAVVSPVLNAQRRVDINKLFTAINTLNENPNSGLNYQEFTTAQFALSMVEGVDRVRFIMDNKT